MYTVVAQKLMIMEPTFMLDSPLVPEFNRSNEIHA